MELLEIPLSCDTDSDRQNAFSSKRKVPPNFTSFSSEGSLAPRRTPTSITVISFEGTVGYIFGNYYAKAIMRAATSSFYRPVQSQ